MATVTRRPEERTGDGHRGMTGVARQTAEAHTEPAPQSMPGPHLLPAVVSIGTATGIGVGTLLGTLFGIALWQQWITVPGWEGIYADGPVTLTVLWGVIGAAMGLILGGVASILLADVDEQQ